MKTVPLNVMGKSKSLRMEANAGDTKTQSMTMIDAFYCDSGTDFKNASLDIERGIRSVAFLLDYLSDVGNEQINGYVAQGLSKCLYFCAEKAEYLREIQILRMAGKTPR